MVFAMFDLAYVLYITHVSGLFTIYNCNALIDPMTCCSGAIHRQGLLRPVEDMEGQTAFTDNRALLMSQS